MNGPKCLVFFTSLFLLLVFFSFFWGGRFIVSFHFRFFFILRSYVIFPCFLWLYRRVQESGRVGDVVNALALYCSFHPAAK